MSEPRINASIRGDDNQIYAVPQNVLFVGQKTSAGTAVTGVLVPNIQNDNSEDTLFGKNSCLAAMVRAYKKINQNTQIDCIPLTDNASSARATGTITFTGTAAQTGVINITVGSRLNNIYAVSVSAGDDETDVATAVAAAINADLTCPVTATSEDGAVTLNAVHKGLIGNDIGVQVDIKITGIAAVLVGMASGTLNPTLTGVFDVVGEKRYQTVCCPQEYGFAFLTNFLDPRLNVENAIQDGVGIMSYRATLADFITNVTPLDSQSLTVLANRLVNDALYKGNAIFELDYVIAAQFSAIRALRLTDGADISSYVVSNKANDQSGGVDLSSLPYHNTPFPYLPIIDIGKSFSLSEEEEINTAGGSILANNTAGNRIVASRILTTYKTNSAGVPDDSFKFLNLADTASAIRVEYFNFCKSQYAQTRLSSGSVVGNSAMVNTITIAADMTGLYQTLAGEGFMLVAAGADSVDFYKKNLVVQITSLANGSVMISMRVIPVTQLRNITLPIQLSFNTLT